MQAIEVKYKGPTYARGSKIIAQCSSETRVFSLESLDQGLKLLGKDCTHYERAWMAATTLANDLGWMDENILVSGTLKNNNEVFILIKKGQYL